MASFDDRLRDLPVECLVCYEERTLKELRTICGKHVYCEACHAKLGSQCPFCKKGEGDADDRGAANVSSVRDAILRQRRLIDGERDEAQMARLLRGGLERGEGLSREDSAGRDATRAPERRRNDEARQSRYREAWTSIQPELDAILEAEEVRRRRGRRERGGGGGAPVSAARGDIPDRNDDDPPPPGDRPSAFCPSLISILRVGFVIGVGYVVFRGVESLTSESFGDEADRPSQ